MAIDPALAKFFAEPDYEMRDRGMVANAIRGAKPVLVADNSGELPKGVKDFFAAPADDITDQLSAGTDGETGGNDAYGARDSLNKGGGTRAYKGTALEGQGLGNLTVEGAISPRTADETAANSALTLEQSGRFALGMQFMQDYPKFRQFVEKGGATGPYDAFMGWIGQGDQGELLRRLDSGQEGLVRLLTGATMPESEARRYASRYSPSPLDGVETATRKIDGLARDIKIAIDAARVGRPFFELFKERYPDIDIDFEVPEVYFSGQEGAPDPEGWREVEPGIKIRVKK